MFYDIFKNLCAAKGVSPTEVARAVGISHTTVYQWRMTGNKPHIDNMKKIADYFDVSLEYLSTDEDYQNRTLSFYERFLELCKDKKISPAKVANDIGISPAAVYAWKEMGTPHNDMLLKLSNYFNVKFDWLTGVSEEKYLDPARVKKTTNELHSYIVKKLGREPTESEILAFSRIADDLISKMFEQ